MSWRSAPAVLAAVVLLSACGLSSRPQAASGSVAVVAAENFWGSIAAQVGGDRVSVDSIVTNPNTDPHSYDPTPADARAFAGAAYVIVNGAGYDAWSSKLLAANPVGGRLELDVSRLAGVSDGGNPHVWYSPDIVSRVVDRIASDLDQLDPAGAPYFDQQAGSYKTAGLKGYHDAIAAIKARYSGVPVGATESIFAWMAPALGLDLITPPGYMKAISEGADPSPADKVTVDAQVAQKLIRVLVFNAQNTTPDVNSLVDKARSEGIPVVAITETLTPASATFQDWQAAQLEALLTALGG
jgi:zinc/manganese transport system substrate-binding protein